MMDIEEFCRKAAEVLRSSERMMKDQIEFWKETPEEGGIFYDPDWQVKLDQSQAAILVQNLSDVSVLLDLLGGNGGSR